MWHVPGTIAGTLVEAGQVGEDQAASWHWVGSGPGEYGDQGRGMLEDLHIFCWVRQWVQ